MLFLIALSAVVSTPIVDAYDIAACGDTRRSVQQVEMKPAVLDHKGRVITSHRSYKNLDSLYAQIIK